MTTLQQVAANQASAEIPINENFETLGGLGIYGKRQAATSALKWGYYGGLYAGQPVADGQLDLAANAANYVTVARATGVISVSTATTAWDDAPNHSRIYKITTGATGVASVEDHRVGGGGLFR